MEKIDLWPLPERGYIGVSYSSTINELGDNVTEALCELWLLMNGHPWSANEIYL